MRLTSQHSVNLPSNLSPIDHEPPASAGTSRVKRGLADNRKLWPPGVITVSLDLKDQKSTALAVDAIQEWAHNTPALQFRIVRSREGDIRICDDESLKGNWSVIGTDAGNIPLNEPTLHLERNDDSKTFRATVLHEFGHALGLLHEHQNPEHTINWNKPAIYKAYASDQFPRELVYSQILELPVGDRLEVTRYDSRSVMHYAYPGYVTHDAKGVDTQHWLSDGDKAIARRLYS